MHKLLILSLSLFAFLACTPRQAVAQDSVPAAVEQRFASLHPTAKKVAWETEANGYEAEYKLNGKEYSDTYSTSGELLETEQEIKKSQLPATVLATLKRDFAGYEIEEAARITYSDGRTVYETELEGEDEMAFDALFLEDGTFVERVALDEKDED
ncbi:PepSY-like domain-containing protein [Lewinella sp. JB7]|uniref:PepSY-like domain-containing protein n=1 Tax=Lewinella sp. JB7 TaxID=2962887 RepID=UPI0020CA03C6|nr:PepSY-like domain-containing protein [Lewinella sp. JB7]MCP9234729.1 PepSY-like domain-containing protein [Lewinella sp. JB7]